MEQLKIISQRRALNASLVLSAFLTASCSQIPEQAPTMLVESDLPQMTCEDYANGILSDRVVALEDALLDLCNRDLLPIPTVPHQPTKGTITT